MAFPYNNYNGYGGYPYGQQMQQPQQQGNSLVRVSGEAEAYNYPMAPGVTMLFTDGAAIYIKTTDASPVGSFRFDVFVRRDQPKLAQTEYVTRAEFEALKASLNASEVKTGE